MLPVAPICPCDLTVELSAAATANWAWHFIVHACAPAIC
jgi:hypothetical protein